MAWTIDEFVSAVENLFGEIVAEFGDIETNAPNPEQKQITLYATEAHSLKVGLRAVEAWDYAQQWADRSGRPIRLCVSGELTENGETATGNWGVKTFQPRIAGGDEKDLSFPTKSALSDKPATHFASSTNEYGTWHVPYWEKWTDLDEEPTTREDEREAAWNRVGVNLRVGNSLLPIEVAKKQRPVDIPRGCALVVFERCSHSCGSPYDWRFTAIPVGGRIVTPEQKEVAIQEPMIISFLDCNGDYAYCMSKGSFEHAKGTWKPTNKVVYHY